MGKLKGKGQILNHSSKELFVIETDSGPPVVHRLGPKRKSPKNVDADGFRRSDGEPILLHNGWWKVPDFCKADVYQVDENIIIPISIMVPVSDAHFGNYKIKEELGWSEEMAYVTRIIKGEDRVTIGYVIDGGEEISVAKGIELAQQGELDNVVVVKNSQGTVFLRTKRNRIPSDNLT